MNPALLAGLRAQCGGPRDGALLRFSLGQALLDAGDIPAAIDELGHALTFDATYSAAWKLLGKAHLANNNAPAAANAWRQGIAVAHQRGNKQAEKEMAVFLRRVGKERGTRGE